jgi:hypothetical protein
MQIRANRKEPIKIVHKFKDGREIADKDFDPDRDLTPKQDEKIIEAFKKVFCVKED